MAGVPAILEFELEPGGAVDAVVAGKALIDWAEAIRAASNVVDPTGQVTVDLLSAEPACLRFTAMLDFIENKVMGKVSDALDPYPKIKHFLALNVLVLPGAVVGGIVVAVATADDPEVAEKQRQVAEAPEVQEHVRSFYKNIQNERSIKRVVVRETPEGPPVMSVDRSEFPERSGLYAGDQDDAAERPGGGVWNVVVTHPVAIAKPLTWGFMRDGLPFRAKMVDQRFLAAIKAGTLPITIQEGVNMEVRVSYVERLEGQVWLPVPGSYRIEEVMSPRPQG